MFTWVTQCAPYKNSTLQAHNIILKGDKFYVKNGNTEAVSMQQDQVALNKKAILFSILSCLC